jgi:hypothetical protein
MAEPPPIELDARACHETALAALKRGHLSSHTHLGAIAAKHAHVEADTASERRVPAGSNCAIAAPPICGTTKYKTSRQNDARSQGLARTDRHFCA